MTNTETNAEILGSYQFETFETPSGYGVRTWRLTPKGKCQKRKLMSNCVYRSVEIRDRAINDLRDSIQKSIEQKDRNKKINQDLAKSFQIQDHIKVGDIICNSWGWEQTNIDFYQVTRLVGRTKFEVKEISQSRTEDGFMSGKCSALKDRFIENGEIHILSGRMKSWNGGAPVFYISNPTSYYYMHLWDGNSKYWSSYA